LFCEARESWIRWLHRLLSIPLWICVTEFDILIVEGIFRPVGCWEYVSLYHKALWHILLPAVLLLLLLASKDWRLPAYSGVLLYSGAEDLLYFIMLRQPFPAVFYWLPGSPTPTILFIRALLAVTLVALLDYCDLRLKLQKRLYLWLETVALKRLGSS